MTETNIDNDFTSQFKEIESGKKINSISIPKKCFSNKKSGE